MEDAQPPLTREQRLAAYRDRIRAKLAERGFTGEELDQQTDALLRRGPSRFDVNVIADILRR
jgi:hypothetical protein